MAEPEDRDLSARYRALPDEAPPAALDAAILDAARRDVRMRRASGLRRWTLPVSLAAVVMLSVLVTLRIEDERPDVAALRESTGLATPVEEKAPDPYAAPPAEKGADPVSTRPAARAPQVSALTSAGKKGSDPISALPAPAPAQRDEAGGMERKLEEKKLDAVAAPAAPVRESGLRAVPEVASAARGSGLAADAARAPVEAPASRDRADMNRAKSEARMQDAAPETPQAWLERIARLRREGRIEEADKALEAFRKRHPDYEIPQAMREAVLGTR